MVFYKYSGNIPARKRKGTAKRKDSRAKLDCERRLITSDGKRTNVTYRFDWAAAGATPNSGFNELLDRIVDGCETDMAFMEAFKKHYNMYMCLLCGRIFTA
jgi:hypothetical protein